MTDAVATHDRWTFRRTLGTSDPELAAGRDRRSRLTALSVDAFRPGALAPIPMR
jgi:hypothetical protein